jgi:hypothetical protein
MPEVGGRLEMVAGEQAEAAGIDREAFVQAELRRKVRDLRVRRGRLPFTFEP